MYPEPVPEMPQITEEDIESSQPGVRFLMVQRLEQLWVPVGKMLERVQQGEEEYVDPRMLEFGIRVVKELSLQYRLQKPLTTSVEEDDGLGSTTERAAMLDKELAELEAKLREQNPGT